MSFSRGRRWVGRLVMARNVYDVGWIVYVYLVCHMFQGQLTGSASAD